MAPGVFGLLVRFTIDEKKYSLEWGDWEIWFRMEAFSTYSLDNGFYYKQIESDLQKLSEADWDTLKFVLQNDGMMTINDIEKERGSAECVGELAPWSHYSNVVL